MEKHVVNTVSLEFSAATYEQAQRNQIIAQDWVKNFLPYFLEKSFEGLVAEGEFFMMDKLEIDIAGLPWELSDVQWSSKIKQALQGQSMKQMPIDFLMEQWLFYLKTGLMEADALLKKSQAFEGYFLRKGMGDPAAAQVQLKVLFTSSTPLKRFLAIHSEDFIQYVFSIYFRLKPEAAKKLREILHKHRDQMSRNLPVFLQRVVLVIQQHDEDQLEFLNRPTTNAILEEWISNGFSKEKITGKKQETMEDISEKSKEREAKFKHVSSSGKELLNEAAQSKRVEPLANATLFCPGAGSVLLLPFISRFFAHCHISEEDKIIPPEKLATALQALHFLTNGEQEMVEEDLILPKILCGALGEDYIEFQCTLNTKVKQEVTELLQSVIGHWSILKDTSIDGLRNSFLQREGRLTIGSAYDLTVENSGVDILLDKIPWGFRNYRLPWMEKSILTTWY